MMSAHTLRPLSVLIAHISDHTVTLYSRQLSDYLHVTAETLDYEYSISLGHSSI